jgi:glycine/D-amino acid oxidase-like deaminating enzyme
MRTTDDNRIIVGGKDISSSDPFKRDELLPAKAKSLEIAFKKLFPSINFKIDFSWAGTFAYTRDGLPLVIGSIPEKTTYYFTLGLGGNGITFSLIAASRNYKRSFIRRKNSDAEIFFF